MNIKVSSTNPEQRLLDFLIERGVSRRAFLKYCTSLVSLLALPRANLARLENALSQAPRRCVIWLSFQACTGCTEALTRSSAPSLESLLFDFLSLDYHDTLQAAAGSAAEAARQEALERFYGHYLLLVDGAVPLAADGACCTTAGRSSVDILRECTEGAAAVLAIGTCSAFGGLPQAVPNPTGAVSVMTLMERGTLARRPLVNLPGCPPIPVVITAILVHYLTFGEFPALDALARPQVFYGHTIHERCSRLHFFQTQQFARRFDDEGARRGWCLYPLGCRGPVTSNACATVKWNGGISFPIQAGHPCLGCSEPDFWDSGGFYQTLLTEAAPAESAEQARTARGEAVFENNCVYCHSPGPAPFRTAPEQIPQVLNDARIRAHRFYLSPEEIEDLVKYLKKSTPQR